MVIQEKSAYLKEENMINIPDFKKFEITLDEKNEANVHFDGGITEELLLMYLGLGHFINGLEDSEEIPNQLKAKILESLSLFVLLNKEGRKSAMETVLPRSRFWKYGEEK